MRGVVVEEFSYELADKSRDPSARRRKLERRRRRTMADREDESEEESRANRGSCGHVPTIYRCANEPGTSAVAHEMR